MRPISLRPISPLAVLVLLVLASCQQQAGPAPTGTPTKETAKRTPPPRPQSSQPLQSSLIADEGQALKEITLEVTGMT